MKYLLLEKVVNIRGCEARVLLWYELFLFSLYIFVLQLLSYLAVTCVMPMCICCLQLDIIVSVAVRQKGDGMKF